MHVLKSSTAKPLGHLVPGFAAVLGAQHVDTADEDAVVVVGMKRGNEIIPGLVACKIGHAERTGHRQRRPRRTAVVGAQDVRAVVARHPLKQGDNAVGIVLRTGEFDTLTVHHASPREFGPRLSIVGRLVNAVDRKNTHRGIDIAIDGYLYIGCTIGRCTCS